MGLTQLLESPHSCPPPPSAQVGRPGKRVYMSLLPSGGIVVPNQHEYNSPLELYLDKLAFGPVRMVLSNGCPGDSVYYHPNAGVVAGAVTLQSVAVKLTMTGDSTLSIPSAPVVVSPGAPATRHAPTTVVWTPGGLRHVPASQDEAAAAASIDMNIHNSSFQSLTSLPSAAALLRRGRTAAEHRGPSPQRRSNQAPGGAEAVAALMLEDDGDTSSIDTADVASRRPKPPSWLHKARPPSMRQMAHALRLGTYFGRARDGRALARRAKAVCMCVCAGHIKRAEAPGAGAKATPHPQPIGRRLRATSSVMMMFNDEGKDAASASDDGAGAGSGEPSALSSDSGMRAGDGGAVATDTSLPQPKYPGPDTFTVHVWLLDARTGDPVTKAVVALQSVEDRRVLVSARTGMLGDCKLTVPRAERTLRAQLGEFWAEVDLMVAARHSRLKLRGSCGVALPTAGSGDVEVTILMDDVGDNREHD